MAATNASNDLGYDMKVGVDLDPSGRSAADVELVADALLHRLEQDTLPLTGAANDQVEFGENLRRWVGEALTQETLEAKGPRLEVVLRRDPRVASVELGFTKLAGPEYDFLITVRARTVNGLLIDRIVGVSSVTVEFLAQGR